MKLCIELYIKWSLSNCVFIVKFLFLFCARLPGQSIKMFIRGRPITMYIPSNIQNYEDLKMEPPSEKLELDWVYPSRVFSLLLIFMRIMLYSDAAVLIVWSQI